MTETVPHASLSEQPRTPPGPGVWGCLLLVVALCVGGIFAFTHRTGNSEKGKGKDKDRPVPIAEAKVTTKDVPVEVKVVGSVTAYTTVPVTAQVNGQLVQVLFHQGDYVYAGQSLFVLDSRPQEASLNQAQAMIGRDVAQISQGGATVSKDMALVQQAQANLAKDQAAVQQARSNLAKDMTSASYANDEDVRYRKLLSQGYVTTEQAEGQRSTAKGFEGTIAADRAAIRSAESVVTADRAAIQSARATAQADAAAIRSTQATLQSDQAAVSSAQVQLGYTAIKAPMAGRTGTLNIFQGTVVKANDTTALTTIAQIQPIYVSFAVPERYLGEIQQAQARAPLEVTAELSDQNPPSQEHGKVSFIENTVDTTTGTILLRATFPNPRRALWPGHFVNVRLLLRTLHNGLLVPSQAVNPGQKGDYVFVVKEDQTVENRPVKVDFTVADMSVIKTGLQKGETVVTDGQLQLTPGAKVEVGGRNQKSTPGEGTPSPGESPAGRRRHKLESSGNQ